MKTDAAVANASTQLKADYANYVARRIDAHAVERPEA
jgi:hypothetical protein